MKTRHYIWSLLLLAMPVLSGCADNEGEFTTGEESTTKNLFMALTLKNPTIKTRQSAEVTQADEKADGSHFRGISDLFILPFSVTATGSDCIAASDVALGSKIGVDETLADLYQTTSNYGAPNDKYYLNVRMPLGTDAFLVYGRATGTNTDLAGKQTNGILAKAGFDGTAASGFTFSPVPMVESVETGKAASAKGDAIIAYLNSIVTEAWTVQANGALFGLMPMVEDMEAGSSASVLAFVSKIYELLLPSKALDYVDPVISAIADGATVDEANAKVTALPSACQGFPADLGLPDGAAVITWDGTAKKFVAVTDKNNIGALNVDVTKFAFPAELWYRANSRIHTSTRPLVSTLSPVQQAESVFNKSMWAGTDDNSVLGQNNGDAKLFTANGVVMPNTTIVAITDPMQYAVARLDVKVLAQDASKATLTKLKDLNDTEFNVSDLEITGILVSKQGPVDFNFSTTTAGTSVVYDSQIGANAKAINTATEYTHTLLLESKKNEAVYIAIELKNNSTENIVTAVPGKTVNDDLSQIIPPGCKFYLVGKLDPAAEAGVTAGTDASAGYVFKQDHTTTVNFVVSDLTKAYYVIPELNSADLELSLKVIDWKLSTPAGIVLTENTGD